MSSSKQAAPSVQMELDEDYGFDDLMEEALASAERDATSSTWAEGRVYRKRQDEVAKGSWEVSRARRQRMPVVDTKLTSCAG